MRSSTGAVGLEVPHDEPARRPLPTWILPLLLIAAVAAVYGRTVGFDFVNFDDEEYVVKNSHVLAGLTWDSLRWAFTTGFQANWHPLTWVSLMADAQLGGARPGMFHLTNVLLHAANVLLLFFLLSRTTGAALASAFVAAVLAVHPLHVESVAWVSERKDVLGAFFGFLGLLAYARWVDRPGWSRYLAVCVALAASLLSKPTFVTFPFLLLLLDYWPLGRLRTAGDLPRRLYEKVPFFALVAASSAITLVVQRSGGAMVPWDVYPLRVRLVNALLSYSEYLRLAFLPNGLAVPYPHPQGATSLGVLAACALLLGSITLAALYCARSRRYFPVGWLWYLGALVPMIGIVQVGAQARADRYTYVPLIGISMLFAWGLPDLAARLGLRGARRDAILTAVASVAIVALAIVAFRQAGFWRDGIALFENAVRVTTHNEMAENNLGSAYFARDRLDEALAHYEAAVAIDPRYVIALNNLAGALNRVGRSDEAIARWTQAVEYRPDYHDARSNLAGALFKAGRIDEAVEQCEAALTGDPQHGASHYNLGRIRLAQGRLDEARAHLEAAVRGMSTDPAPFVNLGVVLARLGRFDEAVSRFEQALAIEPHHEGARRNLELARSRQQDGNGP